MNVHDVRIYPQQGDDFFAACLTDRGTCQFEARGNLDHISSEVRTHYRKVGQ